MNYHNSQPIQSFEAYSTSSTQIKEIIYVTDSSDEDEVNLVELEENFENTSNKSNELNYLTDSSDQDKDDEKSVQKEENFNNKTINEVKYLSSSSDEDEETVNTVQKEEYFENKIKEISYLSDSSDEDEELINIPMEENFENSSITAGISSFSPDCTYNINELEEKCNKHEENFDDNEDSSDTEENLLAGRFKKKNYITVKSKYEMENPNIARRIELIERIYEVNEENYQTLAKEIIDYIKTECNGNAVYWYHAIVYAIFIRPLRVKYTISLLQIIDNEFQIYLLPKYIMGDPQIAVLFYRADFLPYFKPWRFGFDEDNIPTFEEACEFYKRDTIQYILKYDEIDKYLYLACFADFDFNSTISTNGENSISLLTQKHEIYQNQFAAFYGACKCHQLAILNGCYHYDLSFAIASCNQEMVHKSLIKYNNLYECYTIAVKFHNNNAFDFLYNSLYAGNQLDSSNISLMEAICDYNERYFYYFYEEILSMIEDDDIEWPHEGPLSAAGRLENASIVEFLVKNKIGLKDMEVNYNPLHAACMSGNLDIVKIFVSNKVVDINAKSRVTFIFPIFLILFSIFSFIIFHLLISNSGAPIVIAYNQKCFNIVKYLIDNGADINQKIGVNQDTLLIRACKYNQVDMIQYLVSHGAKINVKDRNGDTPIELTKEKSPEGLKILESAIKLR